MMLRFFVAVGIATFFAESARIQENSKDDDLWPGFWNWWGRHQPVQAAWDNHFAAFGSLDVDRILIDYTEDSMVDLYNQRTKAHTVYHGREGAREFFTMLFGNLYDLSGFSAPVIQVNEATPHEPGTVLLAWKVPSSGFSEGMDSIIFDRNSKIVRQNVVIDYQDPRSDAEVVEVNDVEAPLGWTPVRGHYAIYGFDGSPATPTEECVTNPNTGEDYRFGDVVPDSCCQMAGMHDIDEVQFSSKETPCGQFPLQYQPASMQFPLFATAYCNAPNNVIYEEFHCHQTDQADQGCAGCQTTFSHEFNGPVCVKFNDFPGQPQRYYGWLEGCANRGAVHDGWANHFAAFGGQDVERILLDYTEESEITVFNHADNSNTIFKGLSGVRSCFEGFFASLHDTSDLAAPIIHLEESIGEEVEPPTGQVFLVWSAAASGYQHATDSFIFNAKGKITRQNVVVNYAPVQMAWNNHFAAFGSLDVDRILIDYTEDSMVDLYNQRTKAHTVYHGREGAREFFTMLFGNLYDLSGFSAPVIQVNEATPYEPGTVLLAWKVPSSGFSEGMDSIIFDRNSKIVRQNVVIDYQDPRSDAEVVEVNDVEAPHGWTPVRGHYAIYGFDGSPATPAEECVTNPNTGEDYRFGDVVPDSCCQMANMHDIDEVQFSSKETPCGQFPLQYQPASMQFPLFATAYCNAPNNVIYEEFHCHQTDQADQGCAGCQTTFSHEFNGPVCVKFNDFPGQPQRYYGWLEGCTQRAVHDGWANHFAAFGTQDVDMILNDYTETSVITVFNHQDNTNMVFRGLAGVRLCFEDLFANLYDTSDLAAPIIHVEERIAGSSTGEVFLVWSAAASGYYRATDTFVFNNEGKITRQNVVVNHSPIQARWNTHFTAFGTQNLEQILVDYHEQSVINVYNQNTASLKVYNGNAGAREFFTGWFSNFYDLSGFALSVMDVHEATSYEPGSALVTWKVPSSGYEEGMDIVIYDANSKIIRHNCVVKYLDPRSDVSIVKVNDVVAPTGSGPVHAGWANHFAAFGGQDVERILQDYIDESEITVFNHADNSKIVYTGLDGVRRCFEGLFATLTDTSDLAAPIQLVDETLGNEPGGYWHAPDAWSGQVYLVWSAAASGYQRATDTFIFNNEGKITRQSVVLHYQPAGFQGSS